MKLLFDQNLSFKLSRLLADAFPESNQIRLLGMEQLRIEPSGNMRKQTISFSFRRTQISPIWRPSLVRRRKSSGCGAAINQLMPSNTDCAIMRKQ